MNDWIHRWMFDPTIGKLVATAIAFIALYVSVKLVQRTLGRFVTEADARYRVRKFVTFAGYAAGFLVLAVIFSNRLAGFTVAFGVAGAGIAFALQEVISSVAG